MVAVWVIAVSMSENGWCEKPQKTRLNQIACSDFLISEGLDVISGHLRMTVPSQHDEAQAFLCVLYGHLESPRSRRNHFWFFYGVVLPLDEDGVLLVEVNGVWD